MRNRFQIVWFITENDFKTSILEKFCEKIYSGVFFKCNFRLQKYSQDWHTHAQSQFIVCSASYFSKISSKIGCRWFIFMQFCIVLNHVKKTSMHLKQCSKLTMFVLSQIVYTKCDLIISSLVFTICQQSRLFCTNGNQVKWQLTHANRKQFQIN